MKNFLLYYLLFLSFETYGQNLHFAKVMPNISGNSNGLHIATDPQGNSYYCGDFFGSVDFNPNWGVNTIASMGSNDIFLVKLDSLGFLIWAKRIGGSGNDVSRSLYYDPNGTLLLSTVIGGTTDIDPGTSVYNVGAGYYLSRHDTSGNLISVHPLAAEGKITLDINRNIYLHGQFQGTIDFDPGPASFPLTSISSFDYYLLKLDPLGNFMMAKPFVGNLPKEIKDLKVDLLGDIYLLGDFFGAFDTDPNSGISEVYSQGSKDVFVIKLNNQGNLIWSMSYGGVDMDAAIGLGLDKTGNLYIGGNFRATVDFDPSLGIYNLTAPGGTWDDVFYQKIDSSGNFHWAKSFGSTNQDVIRSMVVDSIGNIYSTGLFNGVVDFDPGAGFVYISSSPGSHFTNSIDSAGNYQWAKTRGGTSYGYDITLDSLGNVYLTGVVGVASINWDINSTNFTTTNNTGGAFALKYGPAPGNPLPIKLISFNAYPENNIVELAWETSTETNTALFEIERSSNGNNWKYLDEVIARGNSVGSTLYNFNDTKPLQDLSFYRLKQVDRNGSFTYSPVRSVRRRQNLEQPLLAYPNPTTGRLVIQTSEVIDGNTVSLYNSIGVNVTSEVDILFVGNLVNFNLSRLPVGLYFISASGKKCMIYKE